MNDFMDDSVDDARHVLTGLIVSPPGDTEQQEDIIMDRILSQMEVVYRRVLWARNATASRLATERYDGSATMPPAAQPGEHDGGESHAGEEAQDA